jgi:hypothetical protein
MTNCPAFANVSVASPEDAKLASTGVTEPIVPSFISFSISPKEVGSVAATDHVTVIGMETVADPGGSSMLRHSTVVEPISKAKKETNGMNECV